jgi:hypothetical protein
MPRSVKEIVKRKHGTLPMRRQIRPFLYRRRRGLARLTASRAHNSTPDSMRVATKPGLCESRSGFAMTNGVLRRFWP